MTLPVDEHVGCARAMRCPKALSAPTVNQSQPKTPSTVKVNTEPSVKDKLAELKEMLDDGLISQEDYENKKSDLLDRF
ncbi:MAG TPA: SHOCT domain-containing protein [Gammaproteobacteria bacterium]|nr:MAG: hypothetical protein COA89_07955 [Acidithiobacillus sp.]HIM88393.1 SHOCT domain-containing protein [Gammaproteobacteria bacterium]